MLLAICRLANESAVVASDFDGKKQLMPVEFWEKKTAIVFKLTTPFCVSVTISKSVFTLIWPYLAHLTGAPPAADQSGTV